MSVFITGGTGYLGSYVLDTMLGDDPLVKADENLFILTRSTGDEAAAKLWKALQLHMDADRFYTILDRIQFIEGDLHADGLGLADTDRAQLLEECDSILHIAASLNRKSSKACFNANLRGTLSVIGLAREIADKQGGLRRFTDVSTTAVAGKRENENVGEDESVDWNRSDYDPYARTKKFAEHMVHTLLPDLPTVVLRPSTVMGDTRHPRTTQFDMIRIVCWMLDAPAVPCDPNTRLDFVPASFVGPAIAKLHMKETLKWDAYHLSAGDGACRIAEVKDAFTRRGVKTPVLAPQLYSTFDRISGALANGPKNQLSLVASLIKVFLPYFTNDVVFDNSRVIEELGERPARYTDYCVDLYEWAKSVRFEYPYAPLPSRAVSEAAE